jgi:glycosyltransferase involved in cell wall biosynthesis
MPGTLPQVAVVIAVWDDYCQYLPASVASALSQEGVSVSVVVVDNASQVSLPALPSQAHVVHLPSRLSAGAARNAGLERVTSDEVLFLDADDCLLPGTLARLHRLLASCPGASCAFGRRLLWDPSSGREEPARSPRPEVPSLLRHERLFALSTLFLDSFQSSGCALARTSAVRAGGGFGDATLPEDWMLRSALAWQGRVLFDDEALATRARVHEGSLWHRSHSRRDLRRMYATFRRHMRRGGRMPWLGQVALPLTVPVHAWHVHSLTRAGGHHPLGLDGEVPFDVAAQDEGQGGSRPVGWDRPYGAS